MVFVLVVEERSSNVFSISCGLMNLGAPGTTRTYSVQLGGSRSAAPSTVRNGAPSSRGCSSYRKT